MKHTICRRIIVLAGAFACSSQMLFSTGDWRTKADEIEKKIRSLINEFKNDAPIYQALSATVEPYAQELNTRKEEIDETSTFVTSRFDEIQQEIDTYKMTDEALDQAILGYEAQIVL